MVVLACLHACTHTHTHLIKHILKCQLCNEIMLSLEKALSEPDLHATAWCWVFYSITSLFLLFEMIPFLWTLSLGRLLSNNRWNNVYASFTTLDSSELLQHCCVASVALDLATPLPSFPKVGSKAIKFTSRYKSRKMKQLKLEMYPASLGIFWGVPYHTPTSTSINTYTAFTLG